LEPEFNLELTGGRLSQDCKLIGFVAL